MRGLRPILIAGLVGMLLIFTAAAFEAVRLLNTMRAENLVLRQHALDQAHRLATVRYCILLSQKYLNDPSRIGSAADLRDRWTSMMAELTDSGAGAVQMAQLRTMLERHWLNLNRAISGGLDSGEVGPLQIAAIDMTERVEDIDARQAASTELMMQDQFERLGRGLGLALNLSLASALLLALSCGFYIIRIERQNHRRYEEIVAARRDLESLSSRLVDAQEAERRTISRELHDQVGQTLNAVLVDAANLARRIPPDDEESRRYLNNIRGFADSSVNSIRDIALLLRPSMLDDLGLIPALEWQARETSRRTGIDVRVSADNVDESLPDASRTCIYRLVQEALQNVSRHSAARHVRIDVAQSAGMLKLAIEDDGKGFDTRVTRGLGLLGMEERVRQLGGSIDVHSEPGKGVRVHAAIPAAPRDKSPAVP